MRMPSTAAFSSLRRTLQKLFFDSTNTVIASQYWLVVYTSQMQHTSLSTNSTHQDSIMENRQQEKTQPMDIKLQQERPSYLSDPTALTARPQSALYMDQVRRELSSGELTGRPADHRSSLDSISQLQAEAETSGPTMSALGLEMPRGDRAREPEPPATATRTRSEGILGDMQLTKRATSSFPGGAGESMLTKAVEQSKVRFLPSGLPGRYANISHSQKRMKEVQRGEMTQCGC